MPLWLITLARQAVIDFVIPLVLDRIVKTFFKGRKKP